jgi:perosamine synthetase
MDGKEQIMRIGGTANLRIGKRKSNTDQPSPFPLDDNCMFFFSARYALYHGLSALGLRAGDRLLVPAYCCGTEVDPVLARGIGIEWYGVDGRLGIDVNELRERWSDDIKGLLIIHYLGFDQRSKEILDFCSEKQILLIEDCAHAFLSSSERGEPIGAGSDASIFSIRKSIGIPDGGALHMRNSNASRYDVKLEPPDPLAVFFRAAELLEGNSTQSSSLRDRAVSRGTTYMGKALGRSKILFSALHKLFNVCETSLILINSYDFSLKATNWDMSSFSKKQMRYQDWSGIVAKRRSNFEYLLERIEECADMRPLFPSLPAGTCPLFFPVLTEKRDEFHNSLLHYGIDSHPWWGYFHPEVPWDSFPRAVKLKKEVLGFPIHQSLNHDHMERIIWGIKMTKRNH